MDSFEISHETFTDILATMMWEFYVGRDVHSKINYQYLEDSIRYTLEYFSNPIVFNVMGERVMKATQVNDVNNDLYAMIFDIFHGVNQNKNMDMHYDYENDFTNQVFDALMKQVQYDRLRAAGVDDDLHGVIDI